MPCSRLHGQNDDEQPHVHVKKFRGFAEKNFQDAPRRGHIFREIFPHQKTEKLQNLWNKENHHTEKKYM